jgi:hypothetical protein
MWTREMPKKDGLYWLCNRRLGLSTIAHIQHWADGPHVRLLVAGEVDPQDHQSLSAHWEWWASPLHPPELTLD